MNVGPTVRIGLSSAASAGGARLRGAARRRARGGRRSGARLSCRRAGAPLVCGCIVCCCICLALSSVTMMSPCLDGGLVVDALQRVGPGLARGLAGAGRVELAAELERVRQRRIGLAVDRDRVVHVLAGIAIGEQRGFRRRAQLPCRSSRRRRSGPAWSRTRPGNRRRRRCARRRSGRSGRRAEIGAGCVGLVVVAEQVVEEAAALVARGVGILRAAIVLRQRRHHRAALVVALGAAEPAAAQPLEAGGDLIQVAAHLLDLVVDRTALRRLAAEQREEAGAVAAHALGLRGDAVELGLLAAPAASS